MREEKGGGGGTISRGMISGGIRQGWGEGMRKGGRGARVGRREERRLVERQGKRGDASEDRNLRSCIIKSEHASGDGNARSLTLSRC